jgi:hypothetical protein
MQLCTTASLALCIHHLQDYWLFFPLTRLTNEININATAALGRQVTETSYNAKPFDCQYNMSSAHSSPT